MFFKSIMLGVATVALVACEPIETSNDATETETETVAAEATGVPSGLSREQQGLWNTFSDAGKKLVSECMASGKSFATCTAV